MSASQNSERAYGSHDGPQQLRETWPSWPGHAINNGALLTRSKEKNIQKSLQYETQLICSPPLGESPLLQTYAQGSDLQTSAPGTLTSSCSVPIVLLHTVSCKDNEKSKQEYKTRNVVHSSNILACSKPKCSKACLPFCKIRARLVGQ